MSQTSANVVAGNDAKASDHNKVVADLAEIYAGGPGVPVGGVIFWWSDNTIPLNYKEANGQTIADGSSPLNGLTLPDLRNRFVRGVGNANLRTTPQDGGSDSVTLTINEMPSHSHVQNPHSHRLSNAGGGFGAGPSNPGLFRVDVNSPSVIWSNGNTDTQQPGISNTGGGNAFSILPSYRGLVPIIRYK